MTEAWINSVRLLPYGWRLRFTHNLTSLNIIFHCKSHSHLLTSAISRYRMTRHPKPEILKYLNKMYCRVRNFRAHLPPIYFTSNFVAILVLEIMRCPLYISACNNYLYRIDRTEAPERLTPFALVDILYPATDVRHMSSQMMSY